MEFIHGVPPDIELVSTRRRLGRLYTGSSLQFPLFGYGWKWMFWKPYSDHSRAFSYTIMDPRLENTINRMSWVGLSWFFINSIAIASLDKWDAFLVPLAAIVANELNEANGKPLGRWADGISFETHWQTGYLCANILFGNYNTLTVVVGLWSAVNSTYMWFKDYRAQGGNVKTINGAQVRTSHEAHLIGMAFGVVHGVLAAFFKKRPVQAFARTPTVLAVALIGIYYFWQFVNQKYFLRTTFKTQAEWDEQGTEWIAGEAKRKAAIRKNIAEGRPAMWEYERDWYLKRR